MMMRSKAAPSGKPSVGLDTWCMDMGVGGVRSALFIAMYICMRISLYISSMSLPPPNCADSAAGSLYEYPFCSHVTCVT